MSPAAALAWLAVIAISVPVLTILGLMLGAVIVAVRRGGVFK